VETPHGFGHPGPGVELVLGQLSSPRGRWGGEGGGHPGCGVWGKIPTTKSLVRGNTSRGPEGSPDGRKSRLVLFIVPPAAACVLSGGGGTKDLHEPPTKTSSHEAKPQNAHWETRCEGP